MHRAAVTLIACYHAIAPLLLPAPCRGEDRVLMSYPRFTASPAHRVVSVDKAKREAIVAAAQAPAFMMPSEGPAVLVTSGDSVAAVRIEITEVLDDGSLRVVFGPAAAGAVAEGPVIVGRPFAGDIRVGPPKQASTKAIRGLPDLVSGAAPAAKANAGGDPLAAARAAAHRSQSMNNLKQIALAIHNYYAAHGHFPPAVVIGPDGKPWHSWRVLILPFLEQVELSKQYDFTKPWDSPENQRLLGKMPAVFGDPAVEAGGGKKDSTDYAVLVGDSTMFPPDRNATMQDASDRNAIGNSGLRMAQIPDGTSNTLLVVTLPAERRIPWTQPQDIVVGVDGPTIGTETGIGTNHPVGMGEVALAAWADGSVKVIPSGIDADVLAAIVSRNGGEEVNHDALQAPGADAAPGLRTVRIVADDGGTLRFETD